MEDAQTPISFELLPGLGKNVVDLMLVGVLVQHDGGVARSGQFKGLDFERLGRHWRQFVEKGVEIGYTTFLIEIEKVRGGKPQPRRPIGGVEGGEQENVRLTQAHSQIRVGLDVLGASHSS